VAVVLFVAGGLLTSDRPSFDAGGAEVAAWLEHNDTRIAVACCLFAGLAPLFVWFLATISSLARSVAGSVAFGCGLVFVTLFLADITALAVGALRPRTPEVALALQDFELIAMAAAAFAVVGLLASCATLAIWPRWVSRLAAVTALAYALRVGTVFSTEGAFAADGVLGFWVPVVAFASWLFAASVVLTQRLRAGARLP
jgi:hypothetical protein